jgi:hypothetical protein
MVRAWVRCLAMVTCSTGYPVGFWGTAFSPRFTRLRVSRARGGDASPHTPGGRDFHPPSVAELSGPPFESPARHPPGSWFRRNGSHHSWSHVPEPATGAREPCLAGAAQATGLGRHNPVRHVRCGGRCSPTRNREAARAPAPSGTATRPAGLAGAGRMPPMPKTGSGSALRRSAAPRRCMGPWAVPAFLWPSCSWWPPRHFRDGAEFRDGLPSWAPSRGCRCTPWVGCRVARR